MVQAKAAPNNLALYLLHPATSRGGDCYALIVPLFARSIIDNIAWARQEDHSERKQNCYQHQQKKAEFLSS
jgi:hypothetical protein